MKVQDFCGQMEQDLTSFEQSLTKIEERLDAGGTAAKQNILPIVHDIKNLLTEMRLKKNKLQQECPADF